MSELETAIEVVLDSIATPETKVEDIAVLIKDVTKGEFVTIIRGLLTSKESSESERIHRLKNFMDSRREKQVIQQKQEIVKRKLNNELNRPIGSDRIVHEDPWANDSHHHRLLDSPDECPRLCCLFPRAVRHWIVFGGQWVIFGAIVVYVLRTVWYGTGRPF